MKRVNSESNTKQCLSIAESCASSTTVKTINININEIKRYPTVTNPIKADDLNTPQAYAYTLRRAIVTNCTPEQRAELVKLLNGKDTAEGVTFNNTKANRYRLHRWQNEQSRKERAAMLGEGWQYVDGLNHGTQPGDLVTCIDGTRGRVTNATPECCVIEFETEDGQRLTVAGYFRKERTPLQDSPEITQTAKDFADALEIKTGDRVLSKHYGAMATVLGREYDHRRKVWYYRVEFDTPQKGMDGTERKVTEFKRYGITKNYYPQGTAEIVGNAIYYAEELQADYWGTDSKPRTIFDCEIFKPTDRHPLWILVADIFSSPKEMTLQQVAEYLARRYRESIALPEPPVEITLEDSGEITDEDEKANIDPRFTLNRYNISPASKYINDLGTMCANIRPEDDPEGERLGYCRYMTKKPGGEWTENRCMSWHSLEYSLYVFNAREMTFAESVEDRDGMEKPTDINSLAANIDRLLKRIASRGTAFAEVLSYIEYYPDMGREWLNAMQCRDSLDHFRRWCAARQKHLRRKTA